MKTMIYLDLPLTIHLEAPLHIGSGHGRGLVRRAVVRDQGQNPYIPGASLKGRVREVCEALASKAELPVCGLPRVTEALERAGHEPSRCLICRTFGTIGGNTTDGRGLRWENAYLLPGRGDARWQVLERTQVQLDRVRGVAAEKRLFTAEATAPFLTFSSRVVGWFEGTDCGLAQGYYEVILLLAGLTLVDSFGGMRRRGPGRCAIALPDAIALRIKGEVLPQRFRVRDLLAGVEALPCFLDEARDTHGA